MRKLVLIAALVVMTFGTIHAKSKDVFKMKELKELLPITQDIIISDADGDVVGVINTKYKFTGDVEESFKILLHQLFQLREIASKAAAQRDELVKTIQDFNAKVEQKREEANVVVPTVEPEKEPTK